jgi:hypothetical protein
MRRSQMVLLAFLGVALIPPGECEAQVEPDRQPLLSAVRVDVLERVFPDMPPEAAAYTDPISVPRGGSAAFQFAVRARADAECTMTVRPVQREDGLALAGSVATYQLLPVHVEANNNGGSKTSPSSVPPESWMREFVRKAPFDVAEVLVEAERLELRDGVMHAALVEVRVARDAEPGSYEGALRLQAGEASAEVPFSLRVHGTVLPEDAALHSTHWFWPEPENLTNGERPEWWSERHWALVENSGRQLRAFGQDTIFTPLVEYEEPLIQTVREEDGSYSFDYERFDRWVELFDGLGFRYFAGHHIATLPEQWVYRGVFVTDRQTGRKERLVARGGANEEWLEFIPIFYRSLYGHLQEKGLTERYLQHQLDEPKDGELYRRLAALARTHMPGVQTIDAINSAPREYSPLVDVQVFALTILAREQELAEQRRAQGQSVWLYHCCSPYPPHPNRHLDERLCDSRLYPWLAYLLGAEGYLYWGANIYRGADPYKTSIGPVPSGSQDPGHPPGDNWFFYPGPDGLRASLRMVAFRDGLVDYTLLSMLAERDSKRADEIMGGIARTIADYEREPEAYHRARAMLLMALDE